MKNGRPTIFTEEVKDLILEKLICGQSLRSICREDDMPSKPALMAFIARDKDFQDQYVRAREIQADLMFDEMLDIADDASNDFMDRQRGEYTIQVLNSEHVQRSKLRIDSRKWILSKMLPKKYGEKMQVDMNDVTPIDARKETMAYIKKKLNEDKEAE